MAKQAVKLLLLDLMGDRAAPIPGRMVENSHAASKASKALRLRVELNLQHHGIERPLD